ncbi:glycerate kinase [uncultured Microbacterium sp.]|uniref:glycerate kinase n=1 Tax=uncultured Microbacterium sp. TaxID=191216 RepID=UPI00374A4F22
MVVVVMAPDSFKSTATAARVAAVLAEGWRRVRPADDVRCLPMADGGEGTIDAFEAVGDTQRVAIEVRGPDDRAVATSWLRFLDAEGRRTAVVELASTSGITLLQALRPHEAHTRGFGQAIRAAVSSGVDRLVLAIGGSASTDAGMGMLAELGVRFFDAEGSAVPDGLRGLDAVRRVDFSDALALPSDTVVVCDVTSGLCGPEGAVFGFGAQKGLGMAERDEAERAVRDFARVVEAARPGRADASAPGAGAAGGVGFALTALGVRPGAGAPTVARALGLSRALTGAALAVTGEGRFDEQSAWGKVPGFIADRARVAGAAVAVVAGAIAASTGEFDAAVALADLAPSPAEAMADPERWIRESAELLARHFDTMWGTVR